MEISIFAPFDDASAWFWLSLALILGAVELLATSFFLIWVALAALGMALALAIAPDMGGTEQAALFAVLTVMFTFAGRYWLKHRRRAPGDGRPVLNRRAAALIGRRAKVVRAFDSGLGGLEIDGALWRGRLQPGDDAPPPEGAYVEIHGVEGVVLLVSAE